MKYILLALALFLGTTIVTQAAPFSWNDAGSFINLLAPQNTKPVLVPSLQATSTATSSFASGLTVNGNVGIGTTSPSTRLHVIGTTTTSVLILTGAFTDSTSAIGTIGNVLISTGTSTRWVATSTLGISGGGGGSGTVNSGLTGQLAYYASGGTAVSGTSTLFITASTTVGVGTTTPTDAELEVQSGILGGLIARFWSSTGSTTAVISHATTTVRHSSLLAGFLQASLARLTVGVEHTLGYYRSGRLFGAFTYNGLAFQEGWNQVDCSALANAGTTNADGFTGCDGFYFQEDGVATLNATANGGLGYGRLTTSATADGAGVFLNAPTGGFLIFATSTPIFEATVRIHSVQNQGTTTQTFIGFTNITAGGTTFETAPTAGCFFTASTTIANWRAICRTSLANQTNVDTGIASTTVTTGDGVPYRFLIEADTNDAKFYIQSSEDGNLNNVATINTNVPTTTAMNAGVHFGRASGVTAIGVDIYDMNIGWRKMLAR